MSRYMERRLGALEQSASDAGNTVYVFRWSSQTQDEALAMADAQRDRDGLPPRDTSRPVTFIVFNDGKVQTA